MAKIDWNVAYKWFLEDASRSYSDVANEFGVTKHTVERNAVIVLDNGSKTTWAKRRHSVGKNAQKVTEEEYKKSAASRNETHLLQYRNLQIIISSKIAGLAQEGREYIDPLTKKRVQIMTSDASELSTLARALKIAIDGERVIMGLSTAVSAIKPESEEGAGKGWGELLSLALERSTE